jgi:hypothetical protein
VWAAPSAGSAFPKFRLAQVEGPVLSMHEQSVADPTSADLDLLRRGPICTLVPGGSRSGP